MKNSDEYKRKKREKDIIKHKQDMLIVTKIKNPLFKLNTFITQSHKY